MKKQYNTKELTEFKKLIEGKLKIAEEELILLTKQFRNEDENGTNDTANPLKMFEDTSETLSKEEIGKIANHQETFIRQLKNALIRIENKTYGICRITETLIPKERLLAVPHTTRCIEAKLYMP